MKKSLILLSIVLILGACSPDKGQPGPLSEDQLQEYLKKGNEYAGSTQKVLAGHLIPAIREKGTEFALDFCNIQAYPLTDSMAVELQASVKRVSDQPRNPENTANETELEYIQKAKADLAASGSISPEVRHLDNKVIGYYPIVTSQLCMQCHGNPGSDITESTLAKIKQLYPEDQATGYAEGEIRGIWVVEMDIQEE